MYQSLNIRCLMPFFDEKSGSNEGRYRDWPKSQLFGSQAWELLINSLQINLIAKRMGSNLDPKLKIGQSTFRILPVAPRSSRPKNVSEPPMSQEFKTMQSQTPLFADAKKMQEVLVTEAKAGWDLLEKEDNYRIKLQRDISKRGNDGNLDFDAYRTTVGVSSVLTYGLTALVTVVIVSVILYAALITS